MDAEEPNRHGSFDYGSFVSELRPLIAQARALQSDAHHPDHPVFRAWRHKVVDLTTRISRTHMDSDTMLVHRPFRVMSYGSVNLAEQRKAFDRDLTDTLLELDQIVDYYNKYGAPKLKPGARGPSTLGSGPVGLKSTVEPSKPLELEWPQKERLTLHWVFKHMPLSAWGTLALAIGGAFTLGVTVGSSRSIQHWLEPNEAASEPSASASQSHP